ncbi:uncharacterized protein J4E87_003445 [Alternaria ethzedia]|uniref:uncharacterized protein n=1 Tax=Alternaria ethzedia TaxID=181014 RepID=UPI0020C1E56D|nr:uncharacterized protein J4E87_003445 [Alternaria ethzedia]KAI4629184.1 hypothetical protein J4E87_003445 [Alternaria ethzedia]
MPRSETTIKLTAFQAPAMYQAPTMYQAPDMMQTLDHFGTAGSAHDRVLSGHSHGSTDPSYEYDSPSHASFPEMGYGGISPDGVSLEGSLCEDTSAMELEEPETMNLKDIKAMGIAAGGKLIQDIYKDPYPAKIWNHAAARILHVHILDPTSCEKITHIVPTPPSTDVKAYTEAGGQYFVVEEKVDERLDGGDFDNVKSVSQMDQHIGISTEPEFDPTKPKMCFSAPMNLPGEEPLRVKVPVNVLKIEDGRVRFESVQRSRV